LPGPSRAYWLGVIVVAASGTVNLEALLMRARDAIASDDQVRAVVAVAAIADYRDRLSPTQLTDIP